MGQGGTAAASDTCNGLDDDCDGIVDNAASADDGCKQSMGAGYACKAGACECVTMCDGACVNTQTNYDHCGSCGNQCTFEGGSCQQGKCSPCPATEVDCAGTCVPNDTKNCGTCGNTCPLGATCESGQCKCPLPAVLCGGTCVDTRIDAKHCGACNKACPAGAACQMSSCGEVGTAQCFPACSADHPCDGGAACAYCPIAAGCDAGPPKCTSDADCPQLPGMLLLKCG